MKFNFLNFAKDFLGYEIFICIRECHAFYLSIKHSMSDSRSYRIIIHHHKIHSGKRVREDYYR